MSVVVPAYGLMTGGVPLAQWAGAAHAFGAIVCVALLVCVVLLTTICADVPARRVQRTGRRTRRRPPAFRGTIRRHAWRYARDRAL